MSGLYSAWDIVSHVLNYLYSITIQQGLCANQYSVTI